VAGVRDEPFLLLGVGLTAIGSVTRTRLGDGCRSVWTVYGRLPVGMYGLGVGVAWVGGAEL
jgi:hypothetical protein